jgi:hypothetical protein
MTLPRMPNVALATLLVGAALAYAAPSTQPVKPYPLKTCVVTDEDLGDMGEPVVITHEGREVKFCCGGCVKKFKKDPAPYLKKIEEAEKHPTTKPTK